MDDFDKDVDNMSLDDVAASLLVNENEPEKEQVKKAAPKGETADENTEVEEPDQSVDEKQEDDTASEEVEEDSEAENEDDVDIDELEVEVVVAAPTVETAVTALERMKWPSLLVQTV